MAKRDIGNRDGVKFISMERNDAHETLSRRDLALKLLAGAGAIGLVGCAKDLDGRETPEGTIIQGISGTTATWVDTIVGAAGTASAVTATTLTDATKTWVVNQFAGETVRMNGKVGAITSNTATVLTVSSWTGGTPAVGTYAVGGLRSITGSDTATTSRPTIIVGGYHTTGDGGGGVFYWDKSSSTGDNGGTIFVPNGSSTGRWVRIWSGYIDVKWFGAKGNGVGFDATVGDAGRIQAAVDYAASLASGGTVFFGPGIYMVSSTGVANSKIELRNNVNLLGCGVSSELRAMTNQAHYASRMLSNAGTSTLDGVVIQSLHLNGQRAMQPAATGGSPGDDQRGGIFLNGPRDCKVLDCTIHDLGDGIRLFCPASTQILRVRLAGNNIYSITPTREGIAATGVPQDLIIENNFIHDTDSYSIKVQENVNPSLNDYGVIIRGNTCRNVQGGITASFGVIIANNVIEAHTYYPIQAGPGTEIVGNRILKGIENGIKLDDAGAGLTGFNERIVVADNIITGVTTIGGAVGSLQGIDLRGIHRTRDIIISGNIIENTAGGASQYIGIRAEAVSENIQILNNQIINSTFIGIFVSPAQNGTTNGVHVCNNAVTATAGGVTPSSGIVVAHDPSISAILNHAVVMGNVVRGYNGTVPVYGISIGSATGPTYPTKLVVIGNDASDATTPYFPVLPPSAIGNI